MKWSVHIRQGACAAWLIVCLAGGQGAAAGEPAIAPVCAATLAQLTPVSLEEQVKRKKGKIRLDEKSQCLAFDDDQSLPVALLELPEYVQAYSVNVRSPYTRNAVLVPRVDALDDTRTRHHSVGAAEVVRRGDALVVTVFVNDQTAQVRYLLVYADPVSLDGGETSTAIGLRQTWVGTGFLMSGTDATRSIVYSRAGTVVVLPLGGQWQKGK